MDAETVKMLESVRSYVLCVLSDEGVFVDARIRDKHDAIMMLGALDATKYEIARELNKKTRGE